MYYVILKHCTGFFLNDLNWKVGELKDICSDSLAENFHRGNYLKKLMQSEYLILLQISKIRSNEILIVNPSTI